MKDYDEIKNRIKGPAFSIMTPFLPNEEIDFLALRRNIEQIYDAGGRIFYVMAYNSRFSQLSYEEIGLLSAYVTQVAKGLDKDNTVIVGDPLHCSTKVSKEFAQRAENMGADMISLICREKFYSEEQIYQHFSMVADSANIGILIHEMPFLNGFGGPPVNYPLSLLDRLADLPKVIAIKEDAKDDVFSGKVIARIKDRVAIIISGGGKSQWLRFCDKGCQAWLNGIGVFEPRLAIRFWEHHRSGNFEMRDRIVNEIEAPFFEHGVRKYGWHLTIKAVMEIRGMIHRKERMPLMELNDAQVADLKRLMDTLPIEELASH